MGGWPHAPSENLTVSVWFSFPALGAEHPRGPVALASCVRCCIPLQVHTCVGWKASEGLGISEMGPGVGSPRDYFFPLIWGFRCCPASLGRTSWSWSGGTGF